MRFAGIILIGTLAGCGGSPPAPTAEQPLTLADWNAMPVATKYRAETYERLKLGEAKFQDEKAWDQFYRKTILPGRKKETAGN